MVDPARKLKIFLFGGADGIGDAVRKKLNAETVGVSCVDTFYPGFTSIEDMSTTPIFDRINSSGADFLLVALGARKGQAWLLRNHNYIRVPVRVHLGATINYQVSAVKRAPLLMRKLGLEWLWRIKEEPKLWTRYFKDGTTFLRLMLTHVLPLLVVTRARQFSGVKVAAFEIERTDNQKSVVLNINGSATVQNIYKAISGFQDAARTGRDVDINFTNISHIDARFLGLLTVLKMHLGKRHLKLNLKAVPRRIERIFRLSGFGFLLRT
jgi:N-acetylglucosaminyldiphosphoundecaprenol N-acetyl-beta-D-mannosaminyltransferase